MSEIHDAIAETLEDIPDGAAIPTMPHDCAFPQQDDQMREQGGLSIREYMATHLLAGLLAARPQPRDPFEAGHEIRARLARAAVASADALVDALNASPAPPPAAA